MSPKATAALRSIPQDHKDPKPTHADTRRIELDGELAGHVVVIRAELTARQTMALLRAGDDLASALEVVGQRVVEHDFGGDILDQPLATVTGIINAWTQDEKNRAVDPKSDAS